MTKKSAKTKAVEISAVSADDTPQAEEAPASSFKVVELTGYVTHDGTNYKPGDTMTLNEKEARHVVSSGAGRLKTETAGE